jgi:2-isopropylmalate synthase
MQDSKEENTIQEKTSIAKRDKITVFDTTLRDGMQTPFMGMNFWDRFVIAKAIANMGVDVMEIGFAANDIDFGYMQKMAKYIGSREYSTNTNVPVVCSLARLVKDDIDLAFESIKEADPDKRRIHAFIGTSPQLMEFSHGKREEKIKQMIRDNISHARNLVGKVGEVEYSSEDALRTDPNFLIETINIAIASGASHINIPDTTGGARPDEYFNIIKRIKKDVVGVENIVLSAHIHNDLGNAVATTLKGVEAGVRQIEGSMLQLGERAGNADLMSVIMNIIYQNKHYNVDVSHIDTKMFFPIAELISNITNTPLPLNFPVVGKAAFATSSGIHGKAVITAPNTYLVIEPESVGREKEVVLGQTSGTNTIINFLGNNGYGVFGKDYTEKQVMDMTSIVKKYSAEIKDSLTDTEGKLFAETHIRGKPFKRHIILSDYLSYQSKTTPPRVEIALKVGGEIKRGEGYGNGPYDAFMTAVKNTLGLGSCVLKTWKEDAYYHGRGAPGYEIVDHMNFSEAEKHILETSNGIVSKGQEAIAKAIVEVEIGGKVYHGRGFNRDVNAATYEAIVNAVDARFRLTDK